MQSQPGQGVSQIVYHLFPIDLRRGHARAAPKAVAKTCVGGSLHGESGESVSVVERGQQPILPVLDMLSCRGLIVRNHRKPARHRLQRDIAESLGQAREQEQIAAGVVSREIFAVGTVANVAIRVVTAEP